MNKKVGWKFVVLTVLVAVLASGYFSLTANRGLDTFDEGYLLYNFEKFSRDQLPHRDFYDIYGPGVYFAGGGLFKLFGEKIIVIRIFLIVMKALMAVFIFWIAGELMPYRFAFLASALFVFCWGDALHRVFNVLYGSHCAHFLGLLAILCSILFLQSDKKRFLLAAGFCGGLALLFKLPAGIFILVGLVLFLCYREQLFADGDEYPKEGVYAEGAGFLFGRILKLSLIIGVAGSFALYLLRYRLDIYYFGIFLLPFFLFLSPMLAGEIAALRGGAVSGEGWRRHSGFRCLMGEIGLLALGPASILLLEFLLYWKAGGLEELFYDTFVLPFSINYYWPMYEHRFHALLIAVVFLCGLVFSIAGMRRSKSSRGGELRFFLLVLAVLLGPTAYIFLSETPFVIWRARITHTLWTLSLLAAFPVFAKLRDEEAEEARYKLLLFLCCTFSSLFLLLAFPRSDEVHFLMNSTVIFVLIGFLLWKLNQTASHLFKRKTRLGAIWVAAGACLIILPFLWSLKVFYLQSLPVPLKKEGEGLRFHSFFELKSPRARGVKLHVVKQYVDLDDTIEFIRSHVEPDQPIFVICEDQIIYFLSERDSVLSKENYFAYLSNFGFLNLSGRLGFDDEEMARRLIRTKPRFVIQQIDDVETNSFLNAWPKTAAILKSQYGPTQQFGRFQILQSRQSEIQSAEPATL